MTQDESAVRVSSSRRTADDTMPWRVNVLEAMLRVVSVAGPSIVGFGLIVRGAPRFDSTFALLTAAVTALVVLRFARTLPFRLRAGCCFHFRETGRRITRVSGGFRY